MNGLGSAHEKWAQDDCNVQIWQPWGRDNNTQLSVSTFLTSVVVQRHVINPEYLDPLRESESSSSG